LETELALALQSDRDSKPHKNV